MQQPFMQPEYFEENELINYSFARNLLSWKNSGFGIDNSVRIRVSDNKAWESLAQYITRCPISITKEDCPATDRPAT